MRVINEEPKEENLITKALNIWIFSFLCVLGVIFMVKAPIISTEVKVGSQIMVIETLLILIGVILLMFSVLFAARTWWMHKRLRQHRAYSMERSIIKHMVDRNVTQMNIQCQLKHQQLDYRAYD